MAGGLRFSLLDVRPAQLEVELVDLEVAPAGSRLMRVDPAAAALIIIHFPPQGLAEAAFTGQPTAAPVRALLSGQRARVPGGHRQASPRRGISP